MEEEKEGSLWLFQLLLVTVIVSVSIVDDILSNMGGSEFVSFSLMGSLSSEDFSCFCV